MTWYHTIDLPDGTSTPGWYDTRRAPGEVDWPEAVAGGRCLDVGTFDGFWAFEMERRGASEVIAIDVDDPTALDWAYDQRHRGPRLIREWKTERGRGFREAAARLGSNVERRDISVYDLSSANVGRFDVVLCGALLLHLRDPVRALEAMREVCAGELILIEHLDPFLELAAKRVAAARFAPDWDQWWRTNSAGLVSMVERSGFEITWTGDRFVLPFGPAAPRYPVRATLLHRLAAGQPFTGGLLYRALRGRPRLPTPDDTPAVSESAAAA